MSRRRPPRRIEDVRGPHGKVCLDEVSVRKARALLLAHGYDRTIGLLRTSPATLDKVLYGMPMVEAHARRLQARIAEVSAP